MRLRRAPSTLASIPEEALTPKPPSFASGQKIVFRVDDGPSRQGIIVRIAHRNGGGMMPYVKTPDGHLWPVYSPRIKVETEERR